MKKVDKRYFATLATLLLMIPILITFLYDVFSDNVITWSAYVLGGLVLIFVFFVLPFFEKAQGNRLVGFRLHCRFALSAADRKIGGGD